MTSNLLHSKKCLLTQTQKSEALNRLALLVLQKKVNTAIWAWVALKRCGVSWKQLSHFQNDIICIVLGRYITDIQKQLHSIELIKKHFSDAFYSEKRLLNLYVRLLLLNSETTKAFSWIKQLHKNKRLSSSQAAFFTAVGLEQIGEPNKAQKIVSKKDYDRVKKFTQK